MEDFTDEEVIEIAAYINSLNLCDSQAQVDDHSDANVKNGEKIFKNNCISCHEKSANALGPVIHGQKTEYIENAIKGFQSTWYEPRPSRIDMSAQTDKLSDQDIKDVAAYLNEQKICD